MPLRLQIAFQGGGAKLCDLLAAAQVVEDLKNSGKIEVTRVAGTSAGSIIACLLGINRPLAESIERLKRQGKELLKSLGPIRLSLPTLLRVYTGKPICDDTPLRKLLENLFEDYTELRNLRQPTFIIAADILMGRSEIFSGQINPATGRSHPLISSIMSSCGIPFFFRASGNMGDPAFVDGGICENLPSAVLQPGATSYGPVVAISFDTGGQARPPQDFLDLAKLVINTSINNGVERAKRDLGPAAVHCIDTDIGTFDFHRALEALDGDHNRRVKLECEKWFNSFLLASQGTPSQQIMLGGSRRNPSGHPDMMGRVATLYYNRFRTTKLKISQSTFSVTANSAIKKDDPRRSDHDLLKAEYEIWPLVEPLSCFALTTGSDEQFAGPASWTVKGPDSSSCQFVAIPMDSKAAGVSLDDLPMEHENEIALFFTPPLLVAPEGHQGYKITQQDITVGCMKKLLDDGKDYLAFINRQLVPFERTRLVLYAPDHFRSLDAQPYDREPKLRLVPGRKMTQQELNALGDPPYGFRAIGWAATEDVPPGHALAAWFLAS